MSVTITNLKRDYDRRIKSPELRVYVGDTSLHKIADQWFADNDLMSMLVPSKAWRKLVRTLNNIIEPKLANHFKVPKEQVKYQRTCGCSCGCSPGYKVKQVPGDLQYKSAWAQVQVEPHEEKFLRDMIMSDKFQQLWQQDVQLAQVKAA